MSASIGPRYDASPARPASTWKRPSASSPDPAGNRPLLVIAGPTATGKTALAVALARRFGGEIVGADARQVYRRLDIGTGKASRGELAGVPHHLLDVAAPEESFTVAQYLQHARAAIAGIADRGRLPILTGGTGLYIRAVVDGLVPPEVASQPALRAVLERRWQEDRAGLLAELTARDPVAAARLDRQNARRVIRALEVIEVTGRPFSAQQQRAAPARRYLMLALTAERATLHALADRRIDTMLEHGLVEEVRRLLADGCDFSRPAFSAVGYREAQQYLAGALTLEQLRGQMQQRTHAYQRRQLTWFRADLRYHWLDITAPTFPTSVAEQIAGYLRP